MKRIAITMLDARNFGVELAPMTPEEHAYTTDLIRQLPERKWSQSLGCWKVPTTPFNIRYLRTYFRDDEVDADAHSKIILEYTELTEATASQREKRRWQYVFEGKVPEYKWNADRGSKIAEGVPCRQCTPDAILKAHQPWSLHDDAKGDHWTRDPFKHQIVCADAALGSEFFAYLMEQGTGKTLDGIEEMVAETRKRKAAANGKPFMPFRVLILCPSTLRRTWLDALKEGIPSDVSHWSCRMRTRSNGTEDLVVGMRETADLKVWVCNYERVGPMIDALQSMEFDMVIADEASAIKNPSARRTKAAWALAETCDKRRILTGTIMANSIFDVWAPFEFLQRGCLGYSSYQHFKDQYGVFRKHKNWEKLTGHKNLDELKERMARFSFIVKKEDCLDLPAKTYITRKIEMGDQQADCYEQMAVSFIASLETGGEPANYEAADEYDPAAVPGYGAATVEAKAVIAQIVRFQQITSGFIASQRGPVRIPDGDVKCEAVMDILEEATGKVIVWCRFREDIRYLAEYLAARGVKSVEIHGGVSDEGRERAKHTFGEAPDKPNPLNDDDVRVLIGQPGTGGIGLTLLGTKNQPCSTMIYYSEEWSLLVRLQSEDRAHRIGQRFPLTIYTLVAEGTIDEAIEDALRNKRNLSEALKNVHSIKDLLLYGRRPAPPAASDNPVALRALLHAQGVVIPIEPASQNGCGDFEHDRDNPRCAYCSGDPMTVPVETLLKYWKEAKVA